METAINAFDIFSIGNGYHYVHVGLLHIINSWPPSGSTDDFLHALICSHKNML